MSDMIEAVARALQDMPYMADWDDLEIEDQEHMREMARLAITAHTAALIAGAGDLCERLRSHTSAEDAWYDIDEAAATIAALRAELATARLEGVRLGIEAAKAACHHSLYAVGRMNCLDATAIARRDAALSDLIAGDAHLIDTVADSDGDDGV